MNNFELAAYLLTLPMAEIKAIKRAVNVMVRARMSREESTELVIKAHRPRYESKINALMEIREMRQR